MTALGAKGKQCDMFTVSTLEQRYEVLVYLCFSAG